MCLCKIQLKKKKRTTKKLWEKSDGILIFQKMFLWTITFSQVGENEVKPRQQPHTTQQHHTQGHSAPKAGVGVGENRSRDNTHAAGKET